MCGWPGIELDRKSLADIAVSDPEAFAVVAEQAKAALESDSARGSLSLIESRQNEKLRLVRKLLSARKHREETGLFVVESEDLVEAARNASIEPVELLVAGENVAAGASRRGVDARARARVCRGLPAGRSAASERVT